MAIIKYDRDGVSVPWGFRRSSSTAPPILPNGNGIAGGLRPRLLTFAPSGAGFRGAAYFGGASLRKKNL